MTVSAPSRPLQYIVAMSYMANVGNDILTSRHRQRFFFLDGLIKARCMDLLLVKRESSPGEPDSFYNALVLTFKNFKRLQRLTAKMPIPYQDHARLELDRFSELQSAAANALRGTRLTDRHIVSEEEFSLIRALGALICFTDAHSGLALLALATPNPIQTYFEVDHALIEGAVR